MEKNNDEMLGKIEEAIEAIKELPERAQQAIYWTIAHLDLVKEMCKNPEMTNEEIEKYKKDARAKEDYMMFALLCVAQIYNNGDETAEQ